ncbi:hypothetical protein [Crossiella cryophila]|uniref:Uncharacterized protein n=1 Tax=Crossiella cryophila TaxID=43355 RepID=A0A7W7C5F3_9PSEU|nr:hypothetical protein [Crossiella cryophila]MBB4674850.1 hypothetical protein [Crossiella cryophila]
MQPIPPAVVAHPVTDRPAIEDPRAAAVQTYLRNLLITPVLVIVLAGAVWLLFTVVDLRTEALQVVLGLLLLLVVLLLGMLIRYGPVMRGSRDLMRAERWRPVPVTVLGVTARHFLVEADGACLRFPEVRGRVAHRVAQRTGRLWLVGPSSAGAVVAMLDGFGVPLSGRRVERPAGLTPPAAESFGSAGVAGDDPLVAAWAEMSSRAVRYRVWPHLGAFAFVALLFLGAWLTQGAETIFGVVCLVAVVAFFPIQLRRHNAAKRRYQPWTRLPELLRAGPWQPVGISLAPWQPGRDGHANAHGVIRLVNGTDLNIQLRDANLDLVGNIQQVQGLWIAGDPVPGKLFAVGYPGFPILGLATFEPGMRPV